VFCDRAHQATSSFLGAQSYTAFIQTRDANAFNWLAPNVGNGIHHRRVGRIPDQYDHVE
jgi:hypothetical protein